MRIFRTINESAFRLNLGRTKIYSLVQLGELTLVKVGSKSLITDASIDAYAKRLVDEANGEKSESKGADGRGGDPVPSQGQGAVTVK